MRVNTPAHQSIKVDEQRSSLSSTYGLCPSVAAVLKTKGSYNVAFCWVLGLPGPRGERKGWALSGADFVCAVANPSLCIFVIIPSLMTRNMINIVEIFDLFFLLFCDKKSYFFWFFYVNIALQTADNLLYISYFLSLF